MTYRIQVSKFTTDAPLWWLNFLHSIILTKSNLVFDEIINETLTLWNAVYIDLPYERYAIIQFTTKKDYTWFILRWS